MNMQTTICKHRPSRMRGESGIREREREGRKKKTKWKKKERNETKRDGERMQNARNLRKGGTESRSAYLFANAARSGMKFTLERGSVINDSSAVDKNGKGKRQIRVLFDSYGIVNLRVRTCVADYAS